MNKVIYIDREPIPVSEEVYQSYYKMDRRARYLENDVKVGSSKIDPATGEVKYQPSKEDSIERLMDKNTDFADDTAIEDMVCDKAMMLILTEAMKALNSDEQEIIKDIYYKNLTVREVAKNENVSHVAIIKRHRKVLDKLRKLFK